MTCSKLKSQMCNAIVQPSSLCAAELNDGISNDFQESEQKDAFGSLKQFCRKPAKAKGEKNEV